ncbi:MAG: hypothetical protein L0216_17205 [Planctomycetales bacterium]|nr:hypothetical protein [Planctomycetales bacterium]
MNCRTVRIEIAAAGGDLAALPGVAAHVAGCAGCSAAAEAARSTAALLRGALPARAPGDLTPPSVGARRLPARLADVAEGASPLLWITVPAAAAAAILLVLALGGLGSGRADAPPPLRGEARLEVAEGPDWDGVLAAAGEDAAAGLPGGSLAAAFAARAAENGAPRAPQDR